jgi:N-acetylglucosaminyl-diphospho-decaprenol L-rhamnosyltransferase
MEVLSPERSEGSFARARRGSFAAPVAQDVMPELSIVIVTWNSERWIERCLQSIPAACEGLKYEVVLYDNSSADRTLELVGNDVRSIASEVNDGFAGAINRAITAVRGPYVFLLNPDCELAPRSLAVLVEFLRTHPTAAAAAPLLADERGNSQREFQFRRFPTLMTFAAEVLAIDKVFPSNRVTASYRYRDLDLTRPQVIDQPAAAALLIRREVFNDVGPLDEQFFPAWFEDVDYCRRLAAAGKEIWVVPAAQARHFGGASLEHVPFGRFIDLWYGNMARYARKWFSPGESEALRWIIMMGMILRLVPAALGLAHPEVGRGQALKAYSGVLKKAFDRWGDRSPSS